MIADPTKRLLTNYLRKLTNLSRNNRSIFLLRLLADRHVDVQSLSQLNGETAFKIVESIVAGKSKAICPVVDAHMAAANEASSKLKRLHRIDRFLFEESGANDLHIGWPMVHGKFLDGTCVRCPLLFIPVELHIENDRWMIVPREEGIAFNKSFLLGYSFYNQWKVDEELLDEDFEEVDRDITVFRTAVYQLLQKAKLDVHFNPDNYRDELVPFQNFGKEEFESTFQNGQLKLFPQAVVGIFSQSGSQLVPDYQHLIDENSFADLEEFFAKKSTAQSNDFLKSVKEDKVYNILPLDAWQENALKGVKLGQSLVVQGPPGTGKSQLICNLISDAMANGKRVLVVCQKRAALDVVFARMKEQKLDEFLALVHDFKYDRKEIFDKIARQIERVEEYKARNIGLDAIQFDRKFLQASHRIDQICEELEQFRTTLFDESECEASVKQLYLQSSPQRPFVSLKQEYQFFKFRTLQDFLRKLKQYCSFAERFSVDQYPWKARKSFAKLFPSDLPEIQKLVRSAPLYFEKLQYDFKEAFGVTLDWDQYVALGEQTDVLREIINSLANVECYNAFQRLINETDEETSALWLANTERVLLDCYHEDGVEQVVPASQLGTLQLALERRRKARRNIFSLLYWELFSKDKFLVIRALVGNGLQNNKKGFQALERKLDNRLNLEHNLSKLRAKPWLAVPETINKLELSKWFLMTHRALKSKLSFNSVRGIKNLISVVNLSHDQFLKAMTRLVDLVQPLGAQQADWHRYLTVAQMRAAAESVEVSQHLATVLQRDFEALVQFDLLVESFSTLETVIIEKLYRESNTWQFETNEQLFLNSWSLSWIDHIEMKHPEVRMVSSGKMEMLEQELREQMHIKQSLAQEIVMLRTREKVTEDLEFNRLNNRVTYRDLLHQVTKKRKVWPLRKVLTEFQVDVFRVLPCWLASPESVSAIFPMQEMFDLVVFDEASQCFAERGVPALYRARQALVAGDSKQLRPGDFYLARWEDDLDAPDAEIDSLLELSERYLPSVFLHGHYRSESLDLVNFSNQRFYKNKLQMVPHRHAINQQDSALQFVKVDGVWDKGENAIEAEAVATQVLRHASEHPSDSMGVITFNAPQQSLVLDCLEETFKMAGKALPENLFVKNIENVQGDERDVIIFSIGYAPDKKGKVNAQFGSLNVAGGENRLNVAITRARKKIVVVSSISPEQLEVTGTKNDGPKLLKSYLEFVRNGNLKKSQLGKRETQLLQLKTVIAKLGEQSNIQLVETIPTHDLTVVEGSTFASAILLDDHQYYESPSLKHWHAQLPDLLESKGWPWTKFFSRNSWADEERFSLDVEKWLKRG
ncbi:MAG: AAA domain-containing protein [Bacteroidota bacterium]|nr:DUF4011 domain-containing protein [Cytophagales bacterium]MCZ8071817.1 AAA domain-containing protein [Cytophagales bacterium]